jgi:FkbM family methyltransferase
LGFLWRAWRYRLRLDPLEIRTLLAHVAPGDCAIDVGAHKGGYVYWLHRAVGPTGRVFAFEPQPRIADRLRAALAACDLRNVTLENAAVSDRCGEVTMTLPPGRSTCGATLEPRGEARDTFPVRAVTLDHYFETLPSLRVTFLKCDVEGHELSVFRGADRLLRTHRPALLFECEARHAPARSVRAVFEHLEALGYSGSFFWGGALRPLAEFRPEVHQASPDRRPYANNFFFTCLSSRSKRMSRG